MVPPVIAFGVGGVVGFAILKVQSLQEAGRLQTKKGPQSEDPLAQLRRERDEAMASLAHTQAELEAKANKARRSFNVQAAPNAHEAFAWSG
eukprot:scaffold4454_cov411-Prasinococcus_capsulatus_cf.AAC.5